MQENYFQWNSKLLLSVPNMDAEHKVLITLMSDIYQTNQDKKPFSQIMIKLNELLIKTTQHFRNEENYFSSIAYKRVDYHKKIHKDLLAKLNDHAKEIQKNQKIPDLFFLFLKVWLTAHIMTVDNEYAQVKS